MKICGHEEHNNNCWECTADSLRLENSALKRSIQRIMEMSKDTNAVEGCLDIQREVRRILTNTK
jgi:hypothetical protein